MSGAVDEDTVYRRVRSCLSSVVGGSGHLASYGLDRDSFAVTRHSVLDDGCHEYAFSVTGWRVSEFDDGSAPGEVERLEGRVVLTGDGDLARDTDGRVRIEPWRTLDPARWSDGDDGIEALLADLDEE